MKDKLEIVSLVDQAYKMDLELEKKSDQFFLVLNQEEINITSIIKENAPHILDLTEEQVEEAEFLADFSIDASFELQEEYEQYGEIPNEPQVRSETRISTEIIDSDLSNIVFELIMGSETLFKVKMDKIFQEDENKSFYRELTNIVEDLNS